jgi:hypothetical protein
MLLSDLLAALLAAVRPSTELSSTLIDTPQEELLVPVKTELVHGVDLAEVVDNEEHG